MRDKTEHVIALAFGGLQARDVRKRDDESHRIAEQRLGVTQQRAAHQVVAQRRAARLRDNGRT